MAPPAPAPTRPVALTLDRGHGTACWAFGEGSRGHHGAVTGGEGSDSSAADGTVPQPLPADSHAEGGNPDSGTSLWARSAWLLPSALVAVLALGVSLFGGSFGAGAIAVGGAWAATVFVRDLRTDAGWTVPVAAGMVAGVVLWLLCSQQIAWIFATQTSTSQSRGHGSDTVPAPTPICSGEVQRVAQGPRSTIISTNVSGLPAGSQVTAVASSNAGTSLASLVSHPDSRGVAPLSLTLDVPLATPVTVRAEVRVGTTLLRECVW